MADKKVDLDDLFVEELKPRATPISTVVATECCGVCNSNCATQDPFDGDAAKKSLDADAEARSGADIGAEPKRNRDDSEENESGD